MLSAEHPPASAADAPTAVDPAVMPARMISRPILRPLMMRLSMRMISSVTPRPEEAAAAPELAERSSNGNAEWLLNRCATAIARECRGTQPALDVGTAEDQSLYCRCASTVPPGRALDDMGDG